VIHLSSRAGRRTARAALVPWTLAAATMGAQIGYPLVSGEALRRLTIATVLLFCAASVSHAAATRGAAWAGRLVAVTAGGGLLAEAVGVATGAPFGRYTYADSLGAKLLGVPVVIPLAWTMLAYPAFLAARRLVRGRVAVPLVGGIGLASWDLFLDPQMVAAGHWWWAYPEPALSGVPGIPVTNFAGWLAVSVAMMAILDRLLPAVRADDRLPALLFLWTYASSVLGAAVFFDRPTVALVGGLVMGAVAIPYAAVLWHDRC
jgi:carotene biosynthesis associated membrane protein